MLQDADGNNQLNRQLPPCINRNETTKAGGVVSKFLRRSAAYLHHAAGGEDAQQGVEVRRLGKYRTVQRVGQRLGAARIQLYANDCEKKCSYANVADARKATYPRTCRKVDNTQAYKATKPETYFLPNLPGCRISPAVGLDGDATQRSRGKSQKSSCPPAERSKYILLSTD